MAGGIAITAGSFRRAGSFPRGPRAGTHVLETISKLGV